ncbi:MAG: phosphoribosylglycinamide formyltransferase [Halarcobacter sp.]
MKRIGILSSHNGSGFDTIQKACLERILDAQIVLVISNNFDAKVLQKASNDNIPNFVINSKKFPQENLDKKITKLMLEYKVDYIFLSGFMKKLESNLISTYKNKIINSHPALLPKFGGKGMFGDNVHKAVLEAKEKNTGCTIHFVNENYDEGEYILQKSLEITDGDDVSSLSNRVKNLEAITIVEAFKKLLTR